MSLKKRKATDLPEGDLPTDYFRKDGTLVHSLTAHALKAIERHVESATRSTDVDDATAREEWLTKLYKGWARARLLEH